MNDRSTKSHFDAGAAAHKAVRRVKQFAIGLGVIVAIVVGLVIWKLR